ncbi:MAG TPA: hypothetical protein GXX14_08700 [Clostridiaceae bacterium]|nr:hypothetical protein [Clostridiaceae bacterium]
MLLVLKIFAFALLAAGALTVFGARWLVSKYNLDRNMKVEHEYEMSGEEIEQYKYNKAVINVKMLGMIILLPGLILLLVLFK